MAVRRSFNVRVPMRDGVELSADIYRPDDDERHPVVLSRTPYGKNSPFAFERGTRYVEHGFVLVEMDVRGRGDSDGNFVPYRNDARDGYDAIEWCAHMPWSNGNVATWGGSYNGAIQWLTALTRPPHLKAMIIYVPPADPFVAWPTGTPGGPMHVRWYRLVDGRVLQYVDAVEWTDVYEHLPLATMDERAGFTSPAWREALTHPTLDAWWEPLRYQHRFAEVDLPILHVSGWYDDEQVSTPANFVGMVSNAPSAQARDAQRLIMGPWGHWVNSEHQLGEIDFGPQALIDLQGYELYWLAHHLNGEDNGVTAEAPVRLFVMGANVWRQESSWPPEAVRFVPYHLHSGGNANSRFGDGTLSEEPPAPDEPADVYLHDPARPVPFLTAHAAGHVGGPDDYAAIEQRPDMLVYTTPSLTESIEVIGPVRLVLWASSSAVDTDFIGRLIDVHPSGFCQRLCDGIIRARYRQGIDQEVFLEPGRVERFELDLWNTAQVFKPGHRIRLEVASTAFPKYDRNLGTGEPLATAERMATAVNRVWHTVDYPSHVVLPVVKQQDATE